MTLKIELHNKPYFKLFKNSDISNMDQIINEKNNSLVNTIFEEIISTINSCILYYNEQIKSAIES